MYTPSRHLNPVTTRMQCQRSSPPRSSSRPLNLLKPGDLDPSLQAALRDFNTPPHQNPQLPPTTSELFSRTISSASNNRTPFMVLREREEDRSPMPNVVRNLFSDNSPKEIFRMAESRMVGRVEEVNSEQEESNSLPVRVFFKQQQGLAARNLEQADQSLKSKDFLQQTPPSTQDWQTPPQSLQPTLQLTQHQTPQVRPFQPNPQSTPLSRKSPQPITIQFHYQSPKKGQQAQYLAQNQQKQLSPQYPQQPFHQPPKPQQLLFLSQYQQSLNPTQTHIPLPSPLVLNQMQYLFYAMNRLFQPPPPPQVQRVPFQTVYGMKWEDYKSTRQQNQVSGEITHQFQENKWKGDWRNSL